MQGNGFVYGKCGFVGVRFFGEKSDAGKRAVSIGFGTKVSIFYTRCYKM